MMNDLYEASLSQIKMIINKAEREKLTNSQDFLNFLDELNLISVSY